MNGVAAGLADHEGVAPLCGHGGRLRGLAGSWRPGPSEPGDLVDSRRAVSPAQLAAAPAGLVGQFLARGGQLDGTGR
jgi:hypothetical protein